MKKACDHLLDNGCHPGCFRAARISGRSVAGIRGSISAVGSRRGVRRGDISPPGGGAAGACASRTGANGDRRRRGSLSAILGHAAYGEVSAKRTCKLDESHVETETVNAASATQAATAEAEGQTVMDATHFAPMSTCTRGQIVTFLYKAFGD